MKDHRRGVAHRTPGLFALPHRPRGRSWSLNTRNSRVGGLMRSEDENQSITIPREGSGIDFGMLQLADRTR